MPKVAIYTLATDKYINFLADWIQSIKTHMKFEFDLFVFTDQKVDDPDVTTIFVEHNRRKVICNYKFLAIEQNKECFDDYSDIMFIDVDSIIVCDIEYSEINSKGIFAVKHFAFNYCDRPHEPVPYESNPESSAYIDPEDSYIYYAGGVYGGKTEAFFEFCTRVSDLMRVDIAAGIVPIWLDESYMNRVLLDHPPALTLGVEYNTHEGYSKRVKIQLVRKSVCVYYNL